jgi:hypothetical protein
MEHISHVIRQGKLQGLAWVPLIVAICLNAGAAHPAELATHHLLTLEVARQIASSAELVAEKNGWPCVITVVDSSGYLVTLSRMDASTTDVEPRYRKLDGAVLWPAFWARRPIQEQQLHDVTLSNSTAALAMSLWRNTAPEHYDVLLNVIPHSPTTLKFWPRLG